MCHFSGSEWLFVSVYKYVEMYYSDSLRWWPDGWALLHESCWAVWEEWIWHFHPEGLQNPDNQICLLQPKSQNQNKILSYIQCVTVNFILGIIKWQQVHPYTLPYFFHSRLLLVKSIISEVEVSPPMQDSLLWPPAPPFLQRYWLWQQPPSQRMQARSKHWEHTGRHQLVEGWTTPSVLL